MQRQWEVAGGKYGWLGCAGPKLYSETEAIRGPWETGGGELF